MTRRRAGALSIAAVLVAGIGLTAVGLTLLPDAPTSQSTTTMGDAVAAGAKLATAAPGGIGATATGGPVASTTGSTKTPSATPTPSRTPRHTATPPGTGGDSSGGSSSATLAGRIKPGVTYHGVATFYGATGDGSCMFGPSSNLMVAAMNRADFETAKACGAYVLVHGPGGRTITVRVTDQCPECAVGQLDLSRQAFALLADPVTGRISVTWTLLSPSISGPISLLYKQGSSQYWCAVQVRNHRNPIARMELKVGGTWTAIPRQDYNYFVSADGRGCGGSVRVTDIYGQRITVTGLALRPDVVQSGPAQFSKH